MLIRRVTNAELYFSLSTGTTWYPFGLFQLLVEFVESLIVLLLHVAELLLVDLGLFLKILLQVSHLRLTLAPGDTTEALSHRKTKPIHQNIFTFALLIFQAIECFFVQKNTTSSWKLPQLLLRSRRVQGIFQLSLQGFQLLPQVSAMLISLVPSLSLHLQVVLQLREFGSQIPDLLLGRTLGCSLLLDPGDEMNDMSEGLQTEEEV